MSQSSVSISCIVHTSSSILSKLSVFHFCVQCCSGLAATNNISDTSVLLEWTVDSNSVSTAQTVVVTYEQINPITINGTIETIRVHNPVSVACKSTHHKL